METRPYLLHALSPLHAGTGEAAGLIDLTIARIRATGTPIVPGSSIKGVLRESKRSQRMPDNDLFAVFGPDRIEDGGSTHAGALTVSDARLLALPVRSFRGTFAWVTSPLLMRLAQRDAPDFLPPDVPDAEDLAALVPVTEGAQRSRNLLSQNEQQCVVLEEVDLTATASQPVNTWAGRLAPFVGALDGEFMRRFVVVSDDVMDYFCETAMQVDTRVRIDMVTGVVADKALWTEESLPPETLLLGLLAGDVSRRGGVEMDPGSVLDRALAAETVLQFGGKATVGRGVCRMLPLRDPQPAAGIA